MSNEKTVSEYTMAAAKAMLDEIHPKLPQASNDHNSYCLGSINGHNIAIACLPSGVHGTTSAATVASSMLHTFPSIKFGLMVGIGGGVPGRHSDKNDPIRLGDVVVSKPTNSSGGVLQYDLGKSLGNGLFQRTGSLNKPPQVLLTAVSELQADHMMGFTQIPNFLSQITQKYPSMKTFSYPGKEFDELFEREYEHVSTGVDNDNDGPCKMCDKRRLVPQPDRKTTDPRVHYGIIASGNQLMRDARMRDLLAQEDPGILCFEMEAAGLMDQFPCLVIRGISDYTDSHKSGLWQPYAASVAAAYAKELLSVISARQIWKTTTINEAIGIQQPPPQAANPLLQLAGLSLLGPSTPLHEAIARGQHDVVKSLLEKGVPNINAQDSRGYTPLHIAVEQDDLVSAKALIEKGASTFRPNIMVQPVLKMAVHLGNEEMVKLFLDQGGNVDERDALGYTPLVAAASSGNDKLLTLLIQQGADLNARGSRGGTALHQASHVGHAGAVRILLKAGANPDVRDISGRTPLQIATRLRRENVKKVFAEANIV
ncbi:unc-44 ankyrin, putative [Talaromyces stipitatus ATCC 10500]|uniref:Unc-44 ankyrin, putative n=1 Tax=Talaromyces stipitatus (strain ATCC 10500 / CBS 375.48 / QM 6759 / NRRL 1006) TaxID=441959 RepID=B8LXG9_TALSN|nr:unc-44 ankyrin, putative [Talaromyces stipitatus ATCC 10500]EED23250.1 unc-44 ankyrin, putative [Talaromyces stipitatus ATCC 10500]